MRFLHSQGDFCLEMRETSSLQDRNRDSSQIKRKNPELSRKMYRFVQKNRPSYSKLNIAVDFKWHRESN
jgi:hypothetical protein